LPVVVLVVTQMKGTAAGVLVEWLTFHQELHKMLH
jgi:hypothetical protein